MDIQISNVYIMQASNGLIKIGKANNVETRRQQLEQNANMFNQLERIKIRIIKIYPCYTEIYAFSLETHLHGYFTNCQAGTSSKEVFQVDLQEVLKIADAWHSAFHTVQTIQYHELILRKKDE